MIYELRKEDLTGLGGMMGTEQTSTIWSRIFASQVRAQRVAQEDNGGRPCPWRRNTDGTLVADCGSHGYIIAEKELE